MPTVITFEVGVEKAELNKTTTGVLWIQHRDVNGGWHKVYRNEKGETVFQDWDSVTDKRIYHRLERLLACQHMLLFGQKYPGWHSISANEKLILDNAKLLAEAGALEWSENTKQFRVVKHPQDLE